MDWVKLNFLMEKDIKEILLTTSFKGKAYIIVKIRVSILDPSKIIYLKDRVNWR